MTALLILLCGWYAFGLSLIACLFAVWLWEHATGRTFDPLMREQAREIRELPELEPRQAAVPCPVCGHRARNCHGRVTSACGYLGMDASR